MSTTPGNTKSKSKTFQKESAFMEVMDWVGDNIEVHEWQPEGTRWVGGEPTPHDVRCDLKHRYIITITRFIEPKEKEG